MTSQDFSVIEGVRLLSRQQQLVETGASQTLNSKHLEQDDGFGHAVDLAAYLGTVRWELDLYFPIAEAMADAAGDQGAIIRWGGAWAQLTDDVDARTLHEQYLDRKRAEGKRPFIDAPHFEFLGMIW